MGTKKAPVKKCGHYIFLSFLSLPFNAIHSKIDKRLKWSWRGYGVLCQGKIHKVKGVDLEHEGKNQLKKEENEINKLWTEFNSLLVCLISSLHQTNNSKYVYRYQSKYRFLNIGKNSRGREAKTVSVLLQYHVPVYFITRRDFWEDRFKSKLNCFPSFCELLIHSSPTVGMFQEF